MKPILTFFLIAIVTHQSFAQTVKVHPGVSTHFVCSEPIVYVDISTEEVEGDLPVSNIVRIKPRTERSKGIITIVTATYMAQFSLESALQELADTRVMVSRENATGIILYENTLSVEEMKAFCANALLESDRRPIQNVKNHGITMALNHIHVVGDYFLIDLTFSNATNIRYDIDRINFRIWDEKITKATNIQTRELLPEYQYYHAGGFNQRYRNVFVFRKFTFPDRKVLAIELTEKQVSGRTMTLKVDYKDILQADTF